jgi:hypothetical protein
MSIGPPWFTVDRKRRGGDGKIERRELCCRQRWVTFGAVELTKGGDQIGISRGVWDTGFSAFLLLVVLFFFNTSKKETVILPRPSIVKVRVNFDVRPNGRHTALPSAGLSHLPRKRAADFPTLRIPPEASSGL